MKKVVNKFNRYNYWRNLVEKQEKTGLSAIQFCHHYQLVLSQFYYYRTVFKVRKPNPSRTKPIKDPNGIQLKLKKNVKVYFYTPPIDLRKSVETLCITLEEKCHINPTDGHLFLFRNRHRSVLKILYYQANSFTLLHRKLERGKSIFAKNNLGLIEISREYFYWLLNGPNKAENANIFTKNLSKK